MAAARVVDIEQPLVGRERDPVRLDECLGQEALGAEIGSDAVDAGILQIPLLGHDAGTRIGEIDRAIRLDHDVVRPIEPPALEAVGNHGEAAVELAARDAAGVVLAGHEPALQVAREAVGAIGRLEIDGNAFTWREFQSAAAVDVVEQQVAALLPPQRSFRRAEIAAVA